MSEKLKIVVCHHKDAPMLQQYVDHPELYVHIHAGRAISNDQSPFLRSIAGDDTGENISHLNKLVNEYSVMYWMWKNYDKVGNPDFIGLNHYRRAFTQSDLDEAIKHEVSFYENIIGRPRVLGRSLFEHFLANHGELALRAQKFFWSTYQFQSIFISLAKSKRFFSKNMFVMDKQHFFELMAFLDFCVKQMLQSNQFQQPRELGFVIERLTSLYFESCISRRDNFFQIHIPDNYI